MKKIFAFAFCIFFGVCFLLFPDSVKLSCTHSLTLCGRALIPSLFPFMVLSNFIVKSGILPPSPFILGLVGGYPVGADVLCKLYTEGVISKDAAERALPLCSLCGTGFIFGVVSSVFSPFFALFLWCVHVATALFLAPFPKVKMKNHVLPFTSAFTESVKAALFSVLSVCAFVLTCGLLCDLLPVPKFLYGIFELSRGVIALENTRFSMVLAGFYTSFGGLCVHGQVAALCAEAGISPKVHFTKKLLHGVLTAFVLLLLTFFIF